MQTTNKVCGFPKIQRLLNFDVLMKNSATARNSGRKWLIILMQKKLLTLAFGRRTFPSSQSQHLVFAIEGKPKVWVYLVGG
jgi:hypothetical protein